MRIQVSLIAGLATLAGVAGCASKTPVAVPEPEKAAVESNVLLAPWTGPSGGCFSVWGSASSGRG